MKIFVDADACPKAVKEILYKTAQRLQVSLCMVACQFLKIPNSEYISALTVPASPDAADDKIVEILQKGDLVITADIPLADRVITCGAHAINPRGELYTENNIKNRLAMRDLMDELRSTGEITGGPPIFNKKDTQTFCNQLDRFLTKHLKSQRNV